MLLPRRNRLPHALQCATATALLPRHKQRAEALQSSSADTLRHAHDMVRYRGPQPCRDARSCALSLLQGACPSLAADAVAAPAQILTHRINTALAAGRAVILCGDLNITAAPEDHCHHGPGASVDAFLAERPDRAWLALVTGPRGRLADVFR